MKNKELFKSYLKNQTITTVSFDIFDTLFFRKTATPKDVFYKIGSHKYTKKIFETKENFYKIRIEAEKGARKQTQHDDITLKEIYRQLPLSKKEQDKLISLELKEEKKALYVNPQIKKWIKLAKRNGKKVILISDMYLSKSQIKSVALAKWKKYFNFIDEIYVSSEIKKTKSNGKIFPVILKELAINPQELLHIGDNLNSDVKQPQKFSINTIYYGVDDYLKDTFELEQNYIANYDLGLLQGLRVQTALKNPYSNKEERFFYNLGATLYGMALYGFVKWLDKFARERDIKTINFITREGIVFKKYFKSISDIDTKLIYASRTSTIVASFYNDFDMQRLNFFNSQKQTLQELYDLFKIKLEHKDLVKFKDYDCKKLSDTYINNQTVMSLFLEDLKNKEHTILANIKEQRELFLDYIKALNIDTDGLFVDFGGTGNIFKNISQILNKDFKSALFYKHDLGFSRMYNKKNFSYLASSPKNEKSIKLIQRSPVFIEILLNGTNKTTIGYKRVKNKVVPITQAPIKITKQFQNNIKAFHKGIDSFFNTAKKFHIEKIDSNLISNLIDRNINIPNEQEANYLGNLIHDLGRGGSHTQQIITDEEIKEIKQIGIETIYKEFCKNIGYKKFEYLWPQGAITKIDKDFIKIYEGLYKSYVNLPFIQNFTDYLIRNQIKKINIYGAGYLYRQLKPYLERNRIEVVCLIDTMADVKEFEVEGKKAVSLKDALKQNENHPILIASIKFEEEIYNKIKKYNNNIQTVSLRDIT